MSKSGYTREDIQALAKKPYEELTAEERRLVNLTPWKPGQPGNPMGRKKGTVSWSTRIQRLMDDPDFLKTIVASTPREWDGIVGETPADLISAGIVGCLVKQIGKNLTSDEPIPKETRALIALVSKIGYGDKIQHEISDGFFQRGEINFNIVPDREQENTQDSE